MGGRIKDRSKRKAPKGKEGEGEEVRIMKGGKKSGLRTGVTVLRPGVPVWHQGSMASLRSRRYGKLVRSVHTVPVHIVHLWCCSSAALLRVGGVLQSLESPPRGGVSTTALAIVTSIDLARFYAVSKSSSSVPRIKLRIIRSGAGRMRRNGVCGGRPGRCRTEIAASKVR